LLDDLIGIRKNIAQLTRQIRLLAADELYCDSVKLLCTIPCISHLTAITILTELCSIDRFKTLDTLASYVGLVPGEYSSGERQIMTGLTYRRNNTLRYVIIESAWVAARRDPALMMCFNQWAMKMPKSKAVVKIARKLLSRIRFVLIHRQPYQLGVV
jgi:transposase